MVSKKSSKVQASKISSTSALAASAITKTAQKSSILRSLFSPSQYQLSLFASVIQGLDGQHLRIHEVTTGRLRCDHAIASKATITCLDWGHYGENHSDRRHQESNKKRKRHTQPNVSGPDHRSIVLAFGTSDSEILMFSPHESNIVGTLKGAHTQGIKDFKFAHAPIQDQGWSVGGDGKLVQWDLRSGQTLRSINAPAPSITRLCPLQKSILCASHTTYLVDPDTSAPPLSFTTSSHPVHTIKPCISQSASTSSFLTASESERTIHVFSIADRKLIGTLLPGNETLSISLSPSTKTTRGKPKENATSDRLIFPDQSLAAVTTDGILEVFPSPFDFSQIPNKSDSVKARAKQMTRRPAAVVKIVRPDNPSLHVPLVNCAFDDNDIVMVWAESSLNLLFNRIQWRDEVTGKLLLQGTNELIRAKSGAGVSAVAANGVKDMGRSHVDESHAVVKSGNGATDMLTGGDPSSAIDISSAEDESEHSEIEEDAERLDHQPEPMSQDSSPSNHGLNISPQPVSQDLARTDEDITMEDAAPESDADVGAAGEPESSEEVGEPSFGDLMRANAPETINVQESLTKENRQTLDTTGERSHQLPSALSLGTVLTQSLRTNDVNLLETCFHEKDLAIVRATIERIESSLATILLERLAERLHSRPGRAGTLMVWIQWTLVAHGGYLASQPQLMKKVSSLHRVVGERANSLSSLLALKGKLDMLEAQMNLRKTMQARSRINTLDEGDEEGVIYVEGQDDSDSEADSADGSPRNDFAREDLAEASLHDDMSDVEESSQDSEDGEEDEEDDKPARLNGVVPDSEEADSESDDGGLIDDEAESTEHDSGDEGSEDEVKYDNTDSAESLSESASELEDAPPAKRSTKNKLPNGLGRKAH